MSPSSHDVHRNLGIEDGADGVENRRRERRGLRGVGDEPRWCPSSAPAVGRVGGRLDNGEWLHSVVVLSSRSIAAFSVCHARLAHLTRTGNSRTPAKADSFPSSSTARSGGVVTIL